MAARLATSLDLGTIMVETLQLLHDRFGYGNSSVFLVDESGRWLDLRAAYGDIVDPEGHGRYRQSVEQGLIGEAFRSGTVVRVDDVRADPRYLGVLGGSRAEISVPLLVRGRAIGVLDVQVRQAGVFRDQDELLLREVAERLAPMLYHTRP